MLQDQSLPETSPFQGIWIPHVSGKILLRSTMGIFFSTGNFIFWKIQTSEKISVYFLPKECKAHNQNNSDRVENIATLGILLPGFQEHDFILNMVLQSMYREANP